MTVNYTTLLALGQPVTGTESGNWGEDVNNAITAYLDIAVAGTLSLTSANFTAGALTLANTQGTSTATNITSTTAQYAVLRVSSLAVNSTITAPSSSRIYLVDNADATYTVTVKASGQTGYTVGTSTKAWVYFNGTDYVLASTNDITKLVGTLPVTNGGTGLTSGTSGGIPYYSASSTIASSAALAANALVIGGGAGVAPSTTTTGTGVLTAVGNAVNATGGLVTVDGTATLTNKTLTDPAIVGTILEDVYTIVDGAAFEIDPGNGSIQLITLGASRTPKATNFAAGEAITLMVDDGTAYTITWTDATWGGSGVVWLTDSGVAPTLSATGYTAIVLWKVSTQVYGARVGTA